MAKKKPRKELQEVPLEDLKQGPICHEKGLTPLLEEIARAIFSKVGHLVYPTFEQWELGFMRDLHPWREILVWENIARTFDRCGIWRHCGWRCRRFESGRKTSMPSSTTP
jgi:hypothetical protein